MSGLRAGKHSSDSDDKVKGDDPPTIYEFVVTLVMGVTLGP